MTATNKNAPLAVQGIYQDQRQLDAGKSIPQNDIECNQLPQWMQGKVKKIVRKRAKTVGCTQREALQLVSGEAFLTIRGELLVANVQLPLHLAKALADGSFSALDAMEITALIITEADAQECAPLCDPANVAEFTALKLEALRELLEAEGVKNVL